MQRRSTVIALDCSSRQSVVGVVSGTDLRASRLSPAPTAPSEGVLPMIQECLHEASLGLSNVDAVVVGLGPGSFTGTRIAVATAKGLAQGGSLPVVGVSSLEAAALDTGHHEGPVVVALDARKSEILLGAYRLRDDGRVVDVLLAPTLMAPARIVEVLAARGREGRIRLVGDALATHTDMLEGADGDLLAGDPADPLIGCPVSLSSLAGDRLAGDAFDDPDTLEPVYSRPPPVHGFPPTT